MAPKTRNSEPLSADLADIRAASSHVTADSNAVRGVANPTCSIPAMPNSQSDGAATNLLASAANSKNVVAGRLEAIAEALHNSSDTFQTTEDESAYRLAALGSLNKPGR